MLDDPMPAGGPDLERWLAEADPHSIARALDRALPEARAAAMALLPRDRALRVLCLLEPVHQADLLDRVDHATRRALLDDMEPDDRARLLSVLSDAAGERLLADLAPEERDLTLRLLRYPEDSAGRLMSPEFVRLRTDISVAQALEVIRRGAARAETIHVMPVADDDMRLVGTVDLADLVLAAPDVEVGALASGDVPAVSATDDQEHVARLMKSADLMVVPVVEEDGRLVGIVTFDDAMEVLEFEEGEDLARTGAAEALGRPYLAVPILRLVRSRIVWLCLLAVAATLTVNVLSAFEDTLDRAVGLALFIPLLIGIGGNAGAQSATTVVRALAVNDVLPRDALRVAAREAATGLVMGLAIALAAFLLIAAAFDRGIALVVATTLVAICALAALVGSLMPLTARALSIDPAVFSAPLVTTIVDASGLLIYFLTARAVLDL